MSRKMVPKVPREDGNTDILSCSEKRPSPKYKYDFVLNNWSEQEYGSIISTCESICKKYIIGKEVGESGTPHLQGYISLIDKKRLTELKKLPGFERASFREARNETALMAYCQKDGNFVSKGLPKPIKIISELYPWQKKIEDMYFTEPDGRSIYWYYDTIGGKGKSKFCKYMYVKYKAITIQGGKMADIMNIIFNADMDECRMFIIDVPRNNGNKISYNAVECILNGMITNTKFETGVKVFNPPHVVVFSNFYPEIESLSEDRWKIIDLANE